MYKWMLPDEVDAKHFDSLKYTSSAIMFYWGLDKVHPETISEGQTGVTAQEFGWSRPNSEEALGGPAQTLKEHQVVSGFGFRFQTPS